jgi:superfamily II DNA or RNA helicase
MSKGTTVPDVYVDLAYRPHSAGWDWLQELPARNVFVVGPTNEERAARIGSLESSELRATPQLAASRHLHDGAYAVEVEGIWHALLVFGAKPELAAATGHLRTDSSHLGAAHDLYLDHWATAGAFLGQSPVQVGDMVRPLTSQSFARVSRVSRRADGHVVEVALEGGSQSFDAQDLKIVAGDPRTPPFWLQGEPADHEAMAMLLSWLKLTNPLTDVLYSFAATKTTFKPYQFVPALKILSSSTGRLLIADEVGLGKTIEAGLIWTELEQRAPIRRGLVVVPASLQVKWRQEMERRFMRPLEILKAQDLREFARQLRDDQDPDLLGIISIEAVRGARDVLADLAELGPRFDFVIVDEAHVLRNRSSKSYDVGSLLSDWSDYLVFLSATPLNLGSNDLFNLVNLLDEGGFPDPAVFEGQLEPNRALNAIARNVTSIVDRSRTESRKELALIPAMEHGAAISRRPDFKRLRDVLDGNAPLDHEEVSAIKRMVAELNTLGGILSRTRKVDVPDKKAVRIAEQIEVQWTPQERAFYDAIQQHYRERALGKGVPMGFAMQMPLRQASSCIYVAQQRLWKKENWVTEEDDIGYGLSDGPTEIDDQEAWNGDTSQVLTRPILHDSKLDALRDRLRLARTQGMKQVLIFSFFKGTVEYLAQHLAPEFSTGILHGGVRMQDREAVIDDFRQRRFDILIANQVGSEGLDFQFCNVLVNYDLPWNPMQVEQRIGRLDRFGQEFEKIFIFNMFVPGTIESEIIARLYNRIGVFERSIGDLEPIMRNAMHEINDLLMNPKLSIAQLEAEVDRHSVAAMRQEADIAQLEASSGVLTTVSQLDIDGLTQDGPTSGRYIGSTELERLLQLLFRTYGGSLSAGPREDVQLLRGTRELSVALRNLPRGDRGTMFGLGKLATQVRDGAPIAVTLKPHAVQDESIELITARHPLIRLAVSELRKEPERLSRFGRIRLAGLSDDARYLVRVDVARSEGVRSLCELWVTAVEMSTGQRSQEVEDLVLIDLAEGQFLYTASEGPANLDSLLDQLERTVAERQAAVRSERSQDNLALVDARIESELNSISIKLDRARGQLLSHRSQRDESSLSRMLEGRIRNLSQERDDVRQKYELKRNLTLGTEFAAVLLVTGG